MKKKAIVPQANVKAKSTPAKTGKKVATQPLKGEAPHSQVEENNHEEKILGSLADVFGNKTFQSDAELNAFLDSKFNEGVFPASLELDPLDEAQSIIYEAWNTEGNERIKLAQRALELSENCADAYLILAQEGREIEDDEIILTLLENALDAGLRAIGPNALKDQVGHFWGVMETRPYMRAKFELGKFLYELDEDEKAISHFSEMILLNPNDNQGVRYELISVLLENNLDSEAERILKLYADEESTQLLFFHALLAFRKEGNSKAAQKRLKLAVKENLYVSEYLLGLKKVNPNDSQTRNFGSEEVAENYVRERGHVWHSTEGALAWLAAMEKK